MWIDGWDITLLSYSQSHIDVLVKGEAEFYLTLFYGSPRVQGRVDSWDLLRSLKKDSNKPWVVAGDFNEIMYSWEMEGKRRRQNWQMLNFRNCLEDCELLDMSYKGEKFTFTNRRKNDQEVKARLDRVVANQAWRKAFPKASVQHGFANCSDHTPIVLNLAGTRKSKRRKPDRFEPMWFRHTKFKEVTRVACQAHPTSLPLADRLKTCMQQLSQWGSREFGSVKSNVKNLKEKIKGLKWGPRTEETVEAEAKLSKELDEWLEREELFWMQRSRAEWLRQGDRNTAYFHAKASQRKRRNHIDKLKNQQGEICESEPEIVSIITDYFSNIFYSQPRSRKVKFIRALFQMHPTKAPGLDGFAALFYQNNWGVVGNDVVKEVLDCLNNENLDRRLNETLIVLVPKVKKVERVEELRPISLCNVVMKIITKVLANRMKEILPAIISQSQSAFVEGRLITDNILIAHEVSHFIKGANKQKTGFMSIKLDMSKAYDRIEWRFLESMMLTMGFTVGWVRKIMMCVESVTYKVKVNDIISESIKPNRGLRQGDPISPYLFLICAEWFTYAVAKYQEAGLIRGIKICRNAPVITHLMFADDSMMFLKVREDSIRWISDLLNRYEAISGQKVNLAKSEVVCSKSVTESVRQAIVNRLGMNIVQAHSNYLGLPILFGNKKTQLLRSIEEKVLRKLGDWKHRLLSAAGREVLIKSVLQSIPLYAMSCFKSPISLCRKLAGDLLKFWWHNSKERSIHWIKADNLYKERWNGGLGFRNLS
ncbi:hypothetical protein QQ045_017460 [Rhodiola kirilowii]